MTVKFKKISPEAITPTYGSASAAGADLYNYAGNVVIPAGSTAFVSTGIALEIPEGYVGLVYARSGLACRDGLAPANKVGVIDSDYRGEVKVALFNHSDSEKTVKKGDRIAQLVITPYLRAEFLEGELSCTERASGGFGSTGK